MAERRVRPFIVDLAGAVAILIVLGVAGWWAAQRYVAGRLSPDPTTIASASLAGLREQNRLSAFAARFVAVTTSRQARAGPMMTLAKDATRRAVERSFAMPLRAAGIEAKVTVRFADDPVRDGERWDVSKSLQEVLPDAR